MSARSNRSSGAWPSSGAILCLAYATIASVALAVDHSSLPVNAAGAAVLDVNGQHINYDRTALEKMTAAASTRPLQGDQGPITATAPRFVAESPSGPEPFWKYSIFGSGIGVSNIVIGPAPASGGGREIIIGGNALNGFGGDDFWQAIRHNPVSGQYEPTFVSPVYTGDYWSAIKRIAIGNVRGDTKLEIAVMLGNGRIYLYDLESKKEQGYIDTGIAGLEGMSLADLDGDGRAELIFTTVNDLFVFDGDGTQVWQITGAGGYDVVVGQMDNDPALEIATTSGKIIDAGNRAIQWTRNGGFGAHLKLAPLPGENYQQLIAAQAWSYVFSYDVARQLPRWSINTPLDIGAIEVADVDMDGIPEIIIGDGQWGRVHVHDLYNQQEKWAVNNPEHGVTNIAVADVDGDGEVDLLWGAGWSSTGPDFLYVATTTGSHAIKWQNWDLQGPFAGPAIGDLDGDGHPELVFCSFSSNSGYDSGRILVFDATTLALRGISAPVINNLAWTGVHDLKLREVKGNGRLQIVIGGDLLYDGAIEIYEFDSTNTFTRAWTNTTRPSGSPFVFVEVADLDGNGTRKIIAANMVEHTGSPGVYLYVYDYPSGTNSWRSVALGTGFGSVTGMVVEDLDRNGRQEIAALVNNGDLFTFDGLTRTLTNLRQSTGFSLLSNKVSAAGLIAGDSAGIGHFLRWNVNGYTESFTLELAEAALDAINIGTDDVLWSGSGGVLSQRTAPAYDTLSWQSPPIGSGFGRYVATDVSNGEPRVFSAARQAVVGLSVSYLLNVTAVNGTVIKDPDRPTYVPGSPVTLTAIPANGYGFIGWSGDVSGSFNPLTLTVTSNKNVTANFAGLTASPAISPNGGTFDQKVLVRLFCATHRATIYYTTDGSHPTTASNVYNPGNARNYGIKLAGIGSHTLKAVAVAAGHAESTVAEATFIIR